MTQRIENDSAVLVHLTLELEDGTIAESSHSSGKPVLFRLGDDSLSPGLEAELLGLRNGDKHRFTLSPDQAFGHSNPDLVQFFSRRDFFHTGVPDKGTIMMFSGRGGSEMAGLIRDVACDSITVDFNHPLAGQSVTFTIEVLEINPTSVQSEKLNADIAS